MPQIAFSIWSFIINMSQLGSSIMSLITELKPTNPHIRTLQQDANKKMQVSDGISGEVGLDSRESDNQESQTAYTQTKAYSLSTITMTNAADYHWEAVKRQHFAASFVFQAVTTIN